jgi:hypothetical protein
MVKSEWYREKPKLLDFKIHKKLPRAIHQEDVMPIMNKIFPKAYSSHNNNKKACSVRGWFPPNRKHLDHPDLQRDTSSATGDANSANTSATDPNQMPPLPPPKLNVEYGVGAACLDSLLLDRARSEGAKKAVEKRKLDSDSIIESIKKSQRLTSGVLTQNDVHSLNDPRFLDPFRQCQANAAKKLEKKAADSKARSKKNLTESRLLALNVVMKSLTNFTIGTWQNAPPSSNTKSRRATQECPKSSPNNARNASIGYLIRLHLRRHPPVMQRMMIAPYMRQKLKQVWLMH